MSWKAKAPLKWVSQSFDIFVKLRESLTDETEQWLQIEKIKTKLDHQDKNMVIIFRYLDGLMERRTEPVPRKRIGYKSDDL